MIGRGFLLLLCLSSCDARNPPPTPPSPPAETAARPSVPSAVASLAGEWRVAGIDGQSVEGPVGLALRADAREIWWEPRCAGLVRSYRIDGGRIAIGPRLDLPPRKPGDPTPPVCAIGLPEHIGAVFRALDSAHRIARTPQNGIEISGGGHSVMLFSQ